MKGGGFDKTEIPQDNNFSVAVINMFELFTPVVLREGGLEVFHIRATMIRQCSAAWLHPLR